MTMGIVAVASLAARGSCRTADDDDVYFETHEFGRKRGQAIEFSLCISILNDDIFPLDVAKLAQTLPECLDAAALAEARRPQLDILSVGLSSAAAPRPQTSKAQKSIAARSAQFLTESE